MIKRYTKAVLVLLLNLLTMLTKARVADKFQVIILVFSQQLEFSSHSTTYLP